MQNQQCVPSWTRRRLERHLARRRGPMVVRWMCFATPCQERSETETVRPQASNVIPLRPRKQPGS